MTKINTIVSQMGKLFTGIALVTFCSCSQDEKITLETAEVTKGNIIETVTATGTLESVTSVDVGTQVTGIVSKLYADYNSRVSKGQVIAEIDKTTLESELKSANSTLESARVTFKYNQENYNRDLQLHNKQLISDIEFETTKRDYLVSKAAVEKAEADRVRAQKNLSYAEIYSPIDGIVVAREVEVGQTVVSAMSVANLYTIADLNNMQVVANVDEADIGSVKVGQNASFTVDAYPNDVFHGKVTQVRISPTTTSNVVTYEVLISAANPEQKLIPGLTANVTINVKEANNVLCIPLKVFRFSPQKFEKGNNDLPDFDEPKAPTDGNKPKPGKDGNPQDPAIPTEDMHRLVWVLRGNKLVATEVELGLDNGVDAQIISGVSAGDKIALQYNTEQSGQKADGEANNEGGNSPFMPKPPGGGKK